MCVWSLANQARWAFAISTKSRPRSLTPPSFWTLAKHNNPVQIPDKFHLLPHLTTLSLFGNQFIGHIPRTLANLTALTTLELYNNNFDGGIPDFGGDPDARKLTELSLGSNEVRPELSVLCHCSDFFEWSGRAFALPW